MSINGFTIFKQVALPLVLAVCMLVIGVAVIKGQMGQQTAQTAGAQLAALTAPASVSDPLSNPFSTIPNIAPASGE